MNLGERRVARALALQALYELDCTDHPVEQVLPERLRQSDPDPSPDQSEAAPTPTAENQISEEQRIFIYAIVNGVRTQLSTIDQTLQPYAEERPLDQIAIIDRNILRMAIYEFAIGKQTPLEAAINEAVELAKTFGADSASRFVNGVLGAVADHKAEVLARLEESTQHEL